MCCTLRREVPTTAHRGAPHPSLPQIPRGFEYTTTPAWGWGFACRSCVWFYCFLYKIPRGFEYTSTPAWRWGFESLSWEYDLFFVLVCDFTVFCTKSHEDFKIPLHLHEGEALHDSLGNVICFLFLCVILLFYKIPRGFENTTIPAWEGENEAFLGIWCFFIWLNCMPSKFL